MEPGTAAAVLVLIGLLQQSTTHGGRKAQGWGCWPVEAVALIQQPFIVSQAWRPEVRDAGVQVSAGLFSSEASLLHLEMVVSSL